MEQERFRFTLTIAVTDERHDDAMELLRWTSGRAQDQPGFVDGVLCEVEGEQRRLRLITEWNSQPNLERHLRSELFEAALAAAEFSATEPEIWFEKATELGGAEYLVEVRDASSDEGTSSAALQGEG